MITTAQYFGEFLDHPDALDAYKQNADALLEKVNALMKRLEDLSTQVGEVGKAAAEAGRDASKATSQAEKLAEKTAAEERFWNELKIDVAKKGVWGLLIIVLGLAMIGLAAKFGISVALK